MPTEITVNIDTVVMIVQGDGVPFILPDTKMANVVTPDGELVDSYQNRKSISGKFGAHDLNVRTFHFGRELHIEGSPYAFLSGQNVYTDSEMLPGCLAALKRVCNEYGFRPSAELKQRWAAGDIHLERADLAANFDVGSRRVLPVLFQIGRQLIARGGTVHIHGTSISLMPRKGKEYSIGFYAKGPQLRQSKKIKNIPEFEKFVAECEGILRIEVRLRASELRKRGLSKVSDWKSDTAQVVFKSYMRRLKFVSITSGALTEAELTALPSRLRHVLAAHKAGHDLSLIYGATSLGRHRRDFRKLGIDLKVPNQPANTVLPLTKVLSPQRVIKGAPDWLAEVGLCPAAKSKTAVVGKRKTSTPVKAARSGKMVATAKPVKKR